MEELALTAQRLLSVWWLILWRGSLGGWILGFVAGGIAGFIVGAIGHPELAAVAGGYAGLLGTADRSHGPQEAIQRFSNQTRPSVTHLRLPAARRVHHLPHIRAAPKLCVASERGSDNIGGIVRYRRPSGSLPDSSLSSLVEDRGHRLFEHP
jgi:hypothetical protein